MPSATGENWDKYKKNFADEEEEEKKITPLSDEYAALAVYLADWVTADILRDIQVLKTYGAAPYATALKKLEKQINEKQASVNEKIGVKVVVFSRSDFSDRSDALRNLTPASRRHTFGMLPQIDSVCRRNNHYRFLAARRLFKMRRTRIRANTSSTSSKLPNSLST